jgi:hypothetical protein
VGERHANEENGLEESIEAVIKLIKEVENES